MAPTVEEALQKLLARRDEIILAANIQLAENEAALRLLGWEPEEKKDSSQRAGKNDPPRD